MKNKRREGRESDGRRCTGSERKQGRGSKESDSK